MPGWLDFQGDAEQTNSVISGIFAALQVSDGASTPRSGRSIPTRPIPPFAGPLAAPGLTPYPW